MHKLSIIVPVYKTEKYLRRCLDSLINQTLDKIEIIVVNDGSPDNCQAIIDEYKTKYSHIKAYLKSNGGLSDTRNFGVKKAHGDYIAFLDSDDWVEPDTYQLLYNKAISNDFDIVACDSQLVSDEGIIRNVDSKIKKDLTTPQEIKKLYINHYPVVWNKIFKKELFNNDVVFKKGVWYEDVEFIYRLLYYVKRVGVIKYIGFNYYQRSNSITKVFDQRLYNYIDNWNGIITFYKKKGAFSKYKNELEYSYVRYLYATFMKQACHFPADEFNKALDTAIINVKKNFPHYRRNKYFYRRLKGLYLLTFCRPLAYFLYKIKN